MSTIINASTSSGLVQTADTSGTLELQSNGTTQLTVSSTGTYGQLKSGTAQASTSGTSIDFTSIPSWVKRITVVLAGVSTNGTSAVQFQLGSGSVTTSGYVSAANYAGTAATGSITSTTGFVNDATGNAASVRNSVNTFVNVSGNLWVQSGCGSANTGSAYGCTSGGYLTLSGTLDRVRITTVNGTDTFDAGSINILYEG